MDEESTKRLEKKVKDLEDKLARIKPEDPKPTILGTLPFPSTFVKTLYATDTDPAGSTTVDTVSTFTDAGEKITSASAPEGMYYDPVTGKHVSIDEPWKKPLSAEDVAKAKAEYVKMHGIDVAVEEPTPKMYRTPKTLIIDSHDKVMQLIKNEGRRYDAHVKRHGHDYILRCARHSELLTWCGYISVTANHPCYKLSIEQMKKKYGTLLEAHGGITLTGLGIPTGDIGKQTDTDLWTFGFDTSHAFDYAPGMHETLRKIKKERPGIEKFDGYKDLSFVQTEVVSMLQQIDKMIDVDTLEKKKSRDAIDSKSRDTVDSKYRMSAEPKVVEGTARITDIEEAPFDLGDMRSLSCYWKHLYVHDEI